MHLLKNDNGRLCPRTNVEREQHKAYGVSGGDVCFFYGAFALLLPAGLGSGEWGVDRTHGCHTYGVGTGARLLFYLFI